MIWVIFRVLHIAATCISLGGLFYARMVLLPVIQHMEEHHRAPLMAKLIKRFGYFKWTGIGILAITGLIQLLHNYPTVAHPQQYLLAFGLKMAGAIGLLTVTALLALPCPRLAAMQNNRRLWTGVNLLCGITILVGAALMRYAH